MLQSNGTVVWIFRKHNLFILKFNIHQLPIKESVADKYLKFILALLIFCLFHGGTLVS